MYAQERMTWREFRRLQWFLQRYFKAFWITNSHPIEMHSWNAFELCSYINCIVLSWCCS